MDFEDSVQRLRKDQSKLRGGRRDLAVSQKAKRQAEYQRKQAAKLRAERERKQKIEVYQKKYMNNCDRYLQVKSLDRRSSSSSSSPLLLSPTSIHGEGDKICLSPSILEFLTSTENQDSNNVGNPWTFRIGILNPEYKFPSSPLIQSLTPPQHDDDDHDEDFSDDDDDDDENLSAYNDELSKKYLAYTHCTVVEFTQDEGHVGIPQPIAKAILDSNKTNGGKIPIKRTVDPAGAVNDDDDDDDAMNDVEEDQTPGHLAWGAFDIPDMQLEITLLRLPKGKGCTLVPTKDAVMNGFYDLKDVKLVLEQSLIRTRATLSVGDTVSTWHRGVRFDLNVQKVIPSSYNSITCINTDIEVDIGEAEFTDDQQTKQPQQTLRQPEPEDVGYKLGAGQTLVAPVSEAKITNHDTSSFSPPANLLPEPPEDEKDGVCAIQIQHSGGSGKRRFLIKEARLSDLFAFASTLVGRNPSSFQLVTQYPRRVFTNDKDQIKTFQETGIQQGRERLMVEFL